MNIDLKVMNEKSESDKYFLDRDLMLMKFGNANNGFFGLINWVNEKKLNIPFYKAIFKSHLQTMSNESFLTIQDRMKSIYNI